MKSRQMRTPEVIRSIRHTHFGQTYTYTLVLDSKLPWWRRLLRRKDDYQPLKPNG